ncbi:fibrous sheath-interacting protein 1 isoform X2 [Anabas testudineus]|uniref:fibrous sheath-interacting protein 1 isoform X2 n=1 Tax=Anabas testudineus TaxID=64144 RepID=UPI000E4619CA|nr:fibrous sheath-interacting protein 1 isoform X2 [Anabas testudineus]
MEIIRGSLDDISRPASSEHTGSRVASVSLPHSDRICPTAPFSLVVLTNDAADIQIQSSPAETTHNPSARDPDRGDCHIDVTDEEGEDSKLQKAIEEMRRLDEILSAKISREKETKRQRKEIQAKLWQDFLQNKPQGHAECAHEALNTRLFLALEAPTETEEQDNVVSVFPTQVPDCDKESQQSVKRPDSSTESFEVRYEEAGEEQFQARHCGTSKGKKKQDFVKRNIELVGGKEGPVLLTQSEKERLSMLLREIEEEEEDSARGGDIEEMWAVSVLTAHGYTPEPTDLEQLIDIDTKMRVLLPAEDFLSAQSSYTNFNISRGHGSNVAWKYDWDAQPGEKALQDIKERRGQERRLQEIQQQLEILGQGQEMTNEPPDLTEEELLSLLDECELTESWSQDFEMYDTTS